MSERRVSPALIAAAALAAASIPVVDGGPFVMIRRLPYDADPSLVPRPRPARARYVPEPHNLSDSDREQIEAAARKRERKNAKRAEHKERL